LAFARWIFCLFILVCASSVPLSAYAQETDQPGTRPIGELIGIVDIASVLQQSDAITIIRKAIDEQNTLFQSEISQEEVELRNAEKQLNEDKTSISKEEFEVRLAGFEERVIRLQRQIQAQKNGFDRAYTEAQERLEKELLLIISAIAKERGFAMVLQSKDAVVYDTSLDISEEALARLNAQTKNLKITLERRDQPDG
tara:strand:- start:832 stop:1425 length:594 start_codon:yes stop_codon:yes gene_type:complete